MHVVYGETINDVIMKALEKVLTEGVNVSTRNGDAVSIYDVSMILQNPRSRHLSLVGRKNNIFSTFAETMWVLAGDNRIKPYLNFSCQEHRSIRTMVSLGGLLMERGYTPMGN